MSPQTNPPFPSSPTRHDLLIVEDSQIVRAGITAVLSTHPDLRIVGEAADSETAIANAEVLQPDVVLLDWRVPGVRGGELCAALRKTLPAAGILVVSFSADPAQVRAALDAGANGYLLKDNDGRTLAEAIRTVANGRSVFDRSLAEVIGTIYRSDTKPATNAALLSLPEQEREILRLVAAGHSNKEIGNELGIAEKTVKNHLTHIFDRIGVRTRVQAATAWLRHVGGV